MVTRMLAKAKARERQPWHVRLRLRPAGRLDHAR